MGRMLDALSPARRTFVLGLVAIVLVALLVVAAVAIRSSRANDVHPVAQDTLGPVLVVPGYGGSTAALDDLAAAVKSSGRDVTIVSLPGQGTGDLRQEAEALNSVAVAAMRRTETASVDVVGYSAGGVVARLWVRELGGGNLARRVVTLAAPHHGTDVAGLAVDVAPRQCPLACQQLAPDSVLMRALNAGDETPPGPKFVSIWTDDDEVVTPADSAELSGAVDIRVQDVCADLSLSHSELPRAPVVIAITLLELGSAPPIQPTSRDCARLSS